MAQSLSKNYIHLVFSTKNREKALRKAELADIHAYIAGILNAKHCPVITVGGTENHIHALFVLDKNAALAKVVGEVKHTATEWIRRKYARPSFAWQEGYGAFSVSQSRVSAVVNYIRNQEEHHKHTSFMDELKTFLTQYGVEYNENYL